MVKRFRDKEFVIRYSESEYKFLLNKIEEAKVSRQEFFLNLAKNGIIKKYEINTEVLHHDILKIGNNINQIAKKLNQNGKFDRNDYKEIVNGFSKICKGQSKIINEIQNIN